MYIRIEPDTDGVLWVHFKDGRRMKAKPLVCERCKQEFFWWRDRRFCGNKCQCPFIPPVLFKCECSNCHCVFETKDPEKKWCSHSCAMTIAHSRRATTTSLADTEVLRADNPRFWQDEKGQWWYQPSAERKKHARTRAYVRTCSACGHRYLHSIYHRESKYCSRDCAPKTGNPNGKPPVCRKEKNGNWRGGRYIDKQGYVQLYCPDHPSRQNTTKVYVFEHRLVMEKHIGRYLLPQETVHHKNGVRSDNSLDNLEIWSHSHPTGQRLEDKLEWAKRFLEAHGE